MLGEVIPFPRCSWQVERETEAPRQREHPKLRSLPFYAPTSVLHRTKARAPRAVPGPLLGPVAT